MKRLLLLLVGLMLLAALVHHCLQTRPPSIQADVLACIASRLYARGLADTEVAVDGRDVTLSGFVADEAALERAAALANEDCGARIVANRIGIVVPEPYLTSMCIDKRGGHIAGSVGRDDLRNEVLQRADRQFHGVVDFDLEVRDNARHGHDVLVMSSLQQLTQLERGCITIEDAVLAAEGRIRSAAARDRFVAMLDSAAAGNFTTSFDLSVPNLTTTAEECEQYYAAHFDAGEKVLFDFDSAELHDAGRNLLDRMLAEKAHCANLQIVVSGHTDSVGDPAYNRDLSMRRANAVVDYLVRNAANADRLTAVGYGETQPRADNATEEGRAKNRRIEFRVQEET